MRPELAKYIVSVFYSSLNPGAVFTTSVNGLVPAPGTINGWFLRDDGTWQPASGGGGGLPPDGTYLEITVTASGTQWYPNSAFISSYGRQLILATSAGSAQTALVLVPGTDVQRQNANLEQISSLTFSQGDIIYRGASALTRLNAGTAGLYLQTGGISADPVWASAFPAAGTYGEINVTATQTWVLNSTVITTFGRSLILNTSAGSARSTLGLVIGTNVQAYDITLQSLATLTYSQGNVIYATTSNALNIVAPGSVGLFLQSGGAGAPVWASVSLAGGVAPNTYGEITVSTSNYWYLNSTVITTFGRSLILNTSAGSARTTLGLVIGTDVQGYDITLQSLATLTYSQGDIIYATTSNSLQRLSAGTSGLFLQANGAAAPSWVSVSLAGGVAPGTYGEITVSTSNYWYLNSTVITTFGRSLILNTSAGSARTTLGLVIGTNVQAQNANLQAISTLTFTMGDIIYATTAGVPQRLAAGTSGLYLQTRGNTLAPVWASAFPPTGTYGEINVTATQTWVLNSTVITTYGRSLILNTSAGSARSTLGLVIGTDVQAQNAKLQQIATASFATGELIVQSTASGLVPFAVGLFGQFLQTQGAGALPVWASVTGGGGSGFTSVNLQVFDTSGDHTYTPTSGMQFCIAIITGGGGGGGGVQGDGSTHAAAASGGGGSTGISLFTAASIGASASVFVGSGGSAGVGSTVAVTGGISRFMGVSAYGGNAGESASGGPDGGAWDGQPGGECFSAMINIGGGGSTFGYGRESIGGVLGSQGGASFWGGAPQSYCVQSTAATEFDGEDATAYGAGGGGAVNRDTTANTPGGRGGVGIVAILEFIT